MTDFLFENRHKLKMMVSGNRVLPCSTSHFRNLQETRNAPHTDSGGDWEIPQLQGKVLNDGLSGCLWEIFRVRRVLLGAIFLRDLSWL